MSNKDKGNELDLELFPAVVKAYLQDALEYSPGLNPLKILLPFFTSFGAIVNIHAYIDNYRAIYSNNWVLILGPSGSGKSTGLRLGCELALEENKQQQEKLAKILKDIEEYEKLSAKERTENTAKAWREELERKRLECIVSDPILSDKGSTEGYIKRLHEGQKGFIYASEAQLIYSQFAKEYNRDLKYELIKGYDSQEPISVNLANRAIYIPLPYIGFCGASTLEAVRPFFTEEEMKIGVLARTLIYNFQEKLPRTELYCGKTRNPNITTEAIKLLIAQIHKSFYRLTLDNSAALAYAEIVHEIEEFTSKIDRVNEVLCAFKPRWKDAVLAFAISLALLSNELKTITEKNIRAAYQLVMPAMAATAEIIENHVGLSVFEMDCNKVYELIARNFTSEKLTSYQAIVSSGACKGNLNDYNAILKMLCAQERIAPLKNVNGSHVLTSAEEVFKEKSFNEIVFCPVAPIFERALSGTPKEKLSD